MQQKYAKSIRKKTPEISSIPLFQCCFSEYFLTTFGKVSISPPRTKPLSGHSAGSQRWKFSKIFCAKLSQAAMLNFILPIFFFTEAFIDHHKKCIKTVKMSPQTCLNKQIAWKVQNKCVNLKSFALNIFPISVRMGALDSAQQCSSGSKMCGQSTCLYGRHCQSALTLSYLRPSPCSQHWRPFKWKPPRTKLDKFSEIRLCSPHRNSENLSKLVQGGFKLQK